MIVYARIIDESPPFAVPLEDDLATVSDLLELVRGVRAGGGRSLELLLDGADDDAKLADLGVTEGDLVHLRASGIEDPEAVLPHLVSALDFEALIEAPEPSARRLSEYEEVTQLTQWRGPYHIDGGRPAQQIWSDDASVIRSTNWDGYRAPDELYYRTYVLKQSRADRAVSTVFRFAKESGQLARVSPEHVARMRILAGPLQYPHWGLCVVHQHTTRFAMSSWIAGATSFQMFDELRHAQLHGRLALEYSEIYEGFEDPNPTWMSEPSLQATRKLIEELMTVMDWGQAIILSGALIEPAITSVLQSLLTSDSLSAGDPVTPFVLQSIAEDKARHRQSTMRFVEMVSADPIFGTENLTHINGWVADWGGRAIMAGRDLAQGDLAAEEALAAAMASLAKGFELAGVDASPLRFSTKGA